MISQAAKDAVKRVAVDTMTAGRFLRRVSTLTRGELGDVPVYADGDTFAGRLRTLKAQEVPTEMAQAHTRVYLMICPAGTTLAPDDQVVDATTTYVYEVLGDAGVASDDQNVAAFYVGRVN